MSAQRIKTSMPSGRRHSFVQLGYLCARREARKTEDVGKPKAGLHVC